MINKSKRTNASTLLGVCWIVMLLGCQTDIDQPCEPPALEFRLEEGLRKSWVGQSPVDTFFASNELESFRPLRGIAPADWDSYDWAILNSIGDTVRQWMTPQWVDSTLAVPFGEKHHWAVSLRVSRLCIGQEVVEAQAMKRFIIRHGRPSLLLRNQYDGYLLSRPNEAITITIATQTPPNVTSGWNISGVPVDCPYRNSRLSIGHRAFVVNGGSIGIGECRSMQGIGILAENEVDFRFDYNYHPEGSNERIYETFVGKRKWR